MSMFLVAGLAGALYVATTWHGSHKRRRALDRRETEQWPGFPTRTRLDTIPAPRGAKDRGRP